MPVFEYQVKDKSGKTQNGIQEAKDVSSLVQGLRADGFIIIRVNETKARGKGGSSSSGGPKKRKGKKGNVKLDDLVIFSRQMATLVGAGVPLIQALEILSDQVEKLKFKEIISDMHQAIHGGKSFSESLEKHKKVFSALFINMVRAGEQSGSLEEILDRVASYLEKSAILQRKVKSAMMYPLAVTSLAFLITWGMMTFIIPKFATIFEGLNAELPAMTKMLIKTSHYLQENSLVVFGVMGFTFYFVKQFIKTPFGRLVWDAGLLKMPVFGPLFLKVAVSKFSRTLATLIRSGVAILSALEIVSKTSGNRRIEIVIASLMDSVKKGQGIASSLEKHAIFPTMVVKMIAIGEETGELEEMLIKIADFYDSEVDAAVDGLTSLIEPLIIAFLGVVIGGIVVAMFLPILGLATAVK
ncbi:MAG: type II secretion system F family protein [Candidatus Omnitrophica bacterium]|nr:type II secretion system F family protein [Candidatus Omnitrophota bacterium]